MLKNKSMIVTISSDLETEMYFEELKMHMAKKGIEINKSLIYRQAVTDLYLGSKDLGNKRSSKKTTKTKVKLKWKR